MAEPIEIPLPSGVFCTIRRVTLLDKLYAYARQSDVPFEVSFMLTLIQRCCLFDGESWTQERIGMMDSQDYDAMLKHLSKHMSGPIT